MKKIILRNTVCYLIVIFMIISCTKINTKKIVDEPTLENGYPVILQENDPPSGYPEPENVKINPEDIKIFPEVPDNDPGLGSLTAVLFSPTLSQIIPDTAFYLMPAIGEYNEVPPIIAGPDENQGDVHGFTNEQGFLVLNNLVPDFYYLVVWSPYTWTLAENQEGSPLLIEIVNDSKSEFGIIEVPWP